jgi:hypothetical protein
MSSNLSGLSPDTTYHYRIVATNNAGTTEGIDTTLTTLPATPPTATAEAATGVSQSGATLRGKVNPHGGSISDCHFEYGAGLSYSMTVPCPTAVGVVTTNVAESQPVTGLSPATNYHYRLKVTSNTGTVTSNDSEFTTPAGPQVSKPEVPPAPRPSPSAPQRADKTSPQTFIVKKPPTRIVTGKPRVKVTFAFKSSEPHSLFQCKLDGGRFRPCSARQTFRLEPGRHVVRVRATDSAGNTDRTPAKCAVTVVRRR